MLLLCQTSIKWAKGSATGAKMLYLCDILVVSDELLEKKTNVIGNHCIKLFDALSSNLLVILDNPIDVIAADANFIEN